MPEGLASGESFLVPLSAVPPDVLARAPAETVVVLAAGADPAAVTKTLRQDGFEVSTVADWVAGTSARRERDDVGIMVVLMGLAGLYTALAVVNSVVIAYAARRHEFATARVTGLKRPQVVRMALIESCAVTFIGLFLGGLVVAGTLLGVGAATGSALGTPVVAVPWTLAWLLAAGAFVVTGVTSVLTTLSATRARPVTLVAARE
jgi:putative ABC transport system permease protein